MKIEWSPLAIRRLSEIAEYIARDNQTAARRWTEKVFDRVERLSPFPESGRNVPEVSRLDIREILYGNYRIIYRLEERKISVLTVRHGKQLLPSEEITED